MKEMDKREERFPLGKGVRLVAEDAVGLLAFHKPTGILSHPNEAKDIGRSLLAGRYDLRQECYEMGEKGKPRPVWLLNRLDSGTSGILLCALNKEVADIVRRQFAEGRVRKKYFALVFGAISPSRQVWRDRLHVTHEEGQLRTSAEGSAVAETEVRLERVFPGRFTISLVELWPKTGRTHQLRVQCAKRKLPIVGDQTYGNFSWNREFARATQRKRLFLHSAEVELALEVGGRRVKFWARDPLPGEFVPKG